MSDLISRQAAIDAIHSAIFDFFDIIEDDSESPITYKDKKLLELNKAITKRIRQMPSAQREPTRIISETRAIPSDDDRVSLSETVTATYYDEEHEEWSRKIVTVRDVLDSVCDEYTVLPSAERTGRWTHVYDENEKLFFRNKWICSACGKSNTYGMLDFCPHCGARMENSTRRTKEAKK